MRKRGTSERDNGELEFTRAAYDAVQDAEKSYSLLGTVLLSFDAQRGVMSLAVAFWEVHPDREMGQVVMQRGSWPNAGGASFGAYLFQQCNKAVQMAESWHFNRQQQAANGSDTAPRA